jgi:adenosylcobinamide-phosphate synthase
MAGVAAGGVLALLVTGLWAAAAYFAVRGLHEIHDVAYVLVGAVLLKSTFSLRMLHQAATQVGGLLSSGDIAQARYNLRSLVSRNPSGLSPEQAAVATVESVSENMADSFIGPWLFFALFGLPGAVAYRAINTLDSMIGYRGEYEYLGKASARLDDLVNLIPARLAGLLLVFGSLFLPGQRARGAWRIMWRDHSRTESPNAGWAMSGMAGALGVQLEKTGHYRLGDSTRPVEVHDITQAVRSMYLVAGLGLLVALGLTLLRHGIF